jgi:cellulose-binding protein
LRRLTDWTVRADRAVKTPGEVNRPPVVNLATPNDVVISPKDAVVLDAFLTTDPDGDSLSYRWWRYVDAGTPPLTRSQCIILTIHSLAAPKAQPAP